MDVHAIKPDLIPSIHDPSLQNSPSPLGAPEKSFQSILSEFGARSNPADLISGSESFSQVDFQQMRLELADKIRDAMRSGDADKSLAMLQSEYDRINEQARTVASRDFDEALSRLSSPPQDTALAKIKFGRFAKDHLLTPSISSQIRSVPDCSPMPGKTTPVNPVNCAADGTALDAGKKVALPPQVENPTTERPRESYELSPKPDVPIPGLTVPSSTEQKFHSNNLAPQLRATSSDVPGSGIPALSHAPVFSGERPEMLNSIVSPPTAALHTPPSVISNLAPAVLLPSTATPLIPLAPPVAVPVVFSALSNTASVVRPAAPSASFAPVSAPVIPAPVVVPVPTTSPNPGIPIVPVSAPVVVPVPTTSPNPGIPISVNAGNPFMKPATLPIPPTPPPAPASVPAPVVVPVPTTSPNAGIPISVNAGNPIMKSTAPPIPQTPPPAPASVPAPGGNRGFMEPPAGSSLSQSVAYVENASSANVANNDAMNPFGVTNSVWESVNHDDRLKTTLASMPEKAVALFRETPPDLKREIVDHVKGETHVLWYTISHRKAFIDGEAMGRNTFDYLLGSLNQKAEELMQAGKISADNLELQRAGLNILKTLSAPQREAYVSLLEAENKSLAEAN